MSHTYYLLLFKHSVARRKTQEQKQMGVEREKDVEGWEA